MILNSLFKITTTKPKPIVMSLFQQLTVSEMKVLIDEGVDVNMKNEYDYTPIHIQQDEGVVRLLIDAGADVNARTCNGITPLHHNYNKSEEVIRLLIEAGADVNARNIDGYSPLHFHNDEKVVRLLIKAGADVNAKNIFNSSPIQYKNDEGSIRLLIEAGADVKSRNDFATPLDILIVKRVVQDMASEKITRFIRSCKWFRLHKLTKAFAFNKWYCGEEDGNGGGTGRKVDHKRIMDAFDR